MKLNCRGGLSRPWSISGQTELVCPTSKHSSSGLTPALVHHLEQQGDVAEGVLEDEVEDELLAALRVLRVVHRAHVERADGRLDLRDVGDASLHGPCSAGGEVEDDRAAAPRLLGDPGVDGGLVGGAALVGAGVDVHHRRAGLVRAPRLLRDLDGRVRHPGALLARRQHAGEGAGDDDLVLQSGHARHRPLNSGLRFSRKAATPSAASSASALMESCAQSASSCAS